MEDTGEFEKEEEFEVRAPFSENEGPQLYLGTMFAIYQFDVSLKRQWGNSFHLSSGNDSDRGRTQERGKQ